MKKILFVTWDGPQTNYLQSLFLPIFSQLSDHDYHVSVLQFSWASKEQVASNLEACNKSNIDYRHITVWRKPSVSVGSMLTIFKGKYNVIKAINDWNIDIVMPRSNYPALASMLATAKKPKVKILFDADGLPLDERVDFANSNPTGLIHRFLRDVEAQAVIRANGVITRSKLASQVLQNRAGAGTSIDKFNVVTNGRDTAMFKVYPSESRLRVRKLLNINEDSPLIVYAGSLGPQYCMKQMLQFFIEVKQQLPSTKFLVLSGDKMAFESNFSGAKYLRDDIIFKSLKSQEVGEYLSACDVGLAMRDISFSMQGVAPIKLGEYLLCGLPVIATKGIGDTDMVSSEMGCLIDSNDSYNISTAANWFVNKHKEDSFCSKVINTEGMKFFSVESSVKYYLAALKNV